MENLPANNTKLKTWVDEANPLYKSMVEREKEHWTTQLNDAIRLGGLCASMKAALDHGEWEPFVKTNLVFSTRSADRFMKAFAEKEKLKAPLVADLVAKHGWSRVVDSMNDLTKLEEEDVIDAEEAPDTKQIEHKSSKTETTTKSAETDEFTYRVSDFNVKKTLGPTGARWKEEVKERVLAKLDKNEGIIKALDESLDATGIDTPLKYYAKLEIELKLTWTRE